MVDVELELSAELIELLRELARRYHGDSEDAAISKVVEDAIMMRLLWLDQLGDVANEIDDPVAQFEVQTTPSEEHVRAEIKDFLFRGRQL